MIRHKLLGALVMVGASALVSGCAAHAQANANVGGTAEAEAPVVFVGAPTLVAVDSGVWVVRDAERPVYYVDDTYWVYRDGTWYRSRSYEGGWVIIEASAVPATIATRNHATYVHYKGEATAQTRPAPREGETMTSANTATPPGHEEIPGKGNERKAEGEQPGHAAHTGGLAGSDATHSPASKPGVGNHRKAKGAQPGHAPSAKKPQPHKGEKKDEKKPNAKK